MGEGQSWGVIPPGNREKDGKPHSVRLYSIASSRYGDDMSGKTTTLCVRRATFWCPELKADDPAKKGVCSNYLCDAKPNDEIKLTGPSGKVMLMPEDLRQNPDKMRLDYALSREGPPNKSGGKMYIQDKVEEYSDEVFDALDKGAHMYFCGLKGMMPGIQDMLKGVCTA